MAKAAAAMYAKVESLLVYPDMRKPQIRSGKCPWPVFVQARGRRYPKSVSCGFVPVGGMRLGNFGVAPGNGANSVCYPSRVNLLLSLILQIRNFYENTSQVSVNKPLM